jgi:hypothetical protein
VDLSLKEVIAAQAGFEMEPLKEVVCEPGTA